MATRIGLVLALAALAAATPAAAQPAARCATDSMGNTLCARLASGSAVLSGLGEVVCAAGQCVQDPQGTAWYCSAREGGWARLDPDGPRCEDGCVSPDSNQCRQR